MHATTPWSFNWLLTAEVSILKLNDMFITYSNLKAVKYANNFLALCQCMNTEPEIYQKRHFSTFLMSLFFSIIGFVLYIKMCQLSNSKTTLRLSRTLISYAMTIEEH